MFTGIIESLGQVIKLRSKGSNRIFSIQVRFAPEVKVSDSIAVNGCCLTVINTEKSMFQVEAVAETLKLTNLSRLNTGDYLNLERARQIGDRVEGHIVQGHIDEMARVTNIRKSPGSIELEITLSKPGSRNIVEKGSVALDGISLTIAKVKGQKFSVNIIPFTFEQTNLKYKRIGDWINVEFDIIGKYVQQYVSQRD
jgi:riboflavin synthase